MDDEEANDLTRDLIVTNLKTLNNLLKGLLYYTGQDGSIVKTSNAREVEEHIRPILGRITQILGKTKSAAWCD